ncbi:MAG: FKBP-type peptidyl-prolyl cis-trans isomerase 2 [Lysobacterales bacterium]|jgi:FKBP-type peptidyl-prolyl cis-trans isomerase 2
MKSNVWIFGFLFMCSVLVGHVTDADAARKIKMGSEVAFDYTLTVDGNVVETTEGKKPVDYTQGEGSIIPGLEKELLGMKKGQSKTVTVEPADGYGEINPAAVKDMPISTFPENFVPKLGMVLEFTTPEGAKVPGIVAEIKEEAVLVSFNHPLAGKTLQFDVKVVTVK